MYKLNIDLDRKLAIMAKHEINAEEWLMIELLFVSEDNPELLMKYFNECRKERIPRETLILLQKKNVISKSFSIPLEGQTFDPTQIEFSKSFKNNYFKESYEAGWELFTAYPEYCQSTSGASNQLYPARNITKGGYMDENDLFAKYNKAIQYKIENHNEVMELLEFAKSENLLQYGIVEYITTRKWLAHKELRNSGEINNMQLKVETMRSIN